jgi:N-acetylmuramoyl-L-alanine amidase
VIHYTAMQSTAAALDRLTDPEAEVSAHYLIAEAGTVIALVPEDLRAWHAGAGAWGGVSDVNSRSIGIELANPGTAPFAAPQMDALETLLEGILMRWSIPPERVIGHSDMAPLRKADPGPRFDWRRLALSGLSVWPDSIAMEQDAAYPAFLTSLGCFGYDTSLPADIAIRTFRLRFRPWATGPLDPVDLAMAHDLARRFPVDQNAMGA